MRDDNFNVLLNKSLYSRLHTKKELETPEANRWMIQLQEFDFVRIYTPGNKLILADALIRSKNEETENFKVLYSDS